MAQTYSQRVLDLVKAKHSHEKEFIQAVQEVLSTIEPVLAANSKYKDHAILERIVEPERTILFRVPWIDDQGKVQVNRGYRVEFNSAIGPYKGGLRFHPSVNLGILNLLPTPILDGGHIVFFTLEMIMGRPVSATAREWSAKVGMALLLGLMILATWNDLTRLFS